MKAKLIALALLAAGSLFAGTPGTVVGVTKDPARRVCVFRGKQDAAGGVTTNIYGSSGLLLTTIAAGLPRGSVAEVMW